MKRISFLLIVFIYCSCSDPKPPPVLDEGDTSTFLKHMDDSLSSDRLKETLREGDSLQKIANEYLLHNGNPGNPDEAFQKIHIAFEGMPDVERVQPLLEEVMKSYKIVINNENVMKCANVLVTMKNQSKVGVTEMDILKNVYQTGSTEFDYPTQVAISATLLEKSK